MTMTMAAPVSDMASDVAEELLSSLGLTAVDLRYGLTQDELFAAAVSGDLGRVRPGGPDDEHKAHATALGDDGTAGLLLRPLLHRAAGARHVLCGSGLDQRTGVVEGRLRALRRRRVRCSGGPRRCPPQ